MIGSQGGVWRLAGRSPVHVIDQLLIPQLYGWFVDRAEVI